MRVCTPLAAIALSSSQCDLILTDVEKWRTYLSYLVDTPPGVVIAGDRDTLAVLLARDPAFRNLLYYRLGHGPSEWTQLLVPLLRRIWRPLHSLRFSPDSLGPGCFILHGWGTTILARSIGANFWVGPRVGVGYTAEGEYPTVGDNVFMSIGAIVLGDISIGDDVKVGAGAVVVRDVPDGATVVGVPAHPVS